MSSMSRKCNPMIVLKSNMVRRNWWSDGNGNKKLQLVCRILCMCYLGSELLASKHLADNVEKKEKKMRDAHTYSYQWLHPIYHNHR